MALCVFSGLLELFGFLVVFGLLTPRHVAFLASWLCSLSWHVDILAVLMASRANSGKRSILKAELAHVASRLSALSQQ